MRQVYAHDAVVTMAPDGDIRAPGAAITVALCGHWEHDPPCPLAAHHTAAERRDATVRLRVLFASRPDDEAEVRRRIGEALAGEELETPDGAVARWRLVSSTPGALLPGDVEHGRRLAAD